jgi:hypothetical protein
MADFPSFVKGTTIMWEAFTKVIPAGVPTVEVFEGGNIRVKLGDGVHAWHDLPYFGEPLDVAEIEEFKTNTFYVKNKAIFHEGSLYLAKIAFTTGSTYNANDWLRAVDAYTVNEIDDLLLDKVDHDEIDEDVVVDLAINRTSSTIRIEATTKNILDKSESSFNTPLPLATSALPGMMPKESFAQIVQNTSDIEAIKNKASRVIGDFSGAADPNLPTPAELMSIYRTAANVTVDPPDGQILVNIDNGTEYTWYEYDTSWHAGSTTVPLFQEGAAGLIKGASPTEKGKILAENDATGSVIGFDELENAAENKSATIEDDPTGEKYPTLQAVKDMQEDGSVIAGKLKTEDTDDSEICTTVAEQKNDNYNGFQEEKKILNLKVSREGELTDAEGLAINGVRIDFDHKSLLIKNSHEETKIPLSDPAGYKITSPYATIEAYNRLFIFDEATVGKGIIRNSDDTIEEVTDLGIYAPEGTINVIRIIDLEERDVAYVISEKSQTKSLIIYPPDETHEKGSYKICDFLTLERTPQNAHDIMLLTSVDGKRHSWIMVNRHAIGAAADATVTEWCLFQIEDAVHSFINASTVSCDGFEATGFVPNNNFSNMFTWEAHEDLDDLPSTHTSLMINTTRATNAGNARLPYHTGEWFSEGGSPVKRNARTVALHTGVYHHHLGATLLSSITDTFAQYILATPEGFLGWFNIMGAGTATQTWYGRCFREITIQSGPYRGKRALLLFPQVLASYFPMIVNTYDGDPNNTVVTLLRTDTQNLNHLSGDNPLQAGFTFAPAFHFVDFNRIYLSTADDAPAVTHAHFVYINQSEIAPPVGGYNKSNNAFTSTLIKRSFDLRILDLRLATNVSGVGFPNGYANTAMIFKPRAYIYMERINFGPQHGTLIQNTSVAGGSLCDMFLPDDPDSENVKPYGIYHHEGYLSTSFNMNLGEDMHFNQRENQRVYWHDHLIMSMAAADIFATDYYWEPLSRGGIGGIVVKKLASPASSYPIVVDDKFLLLLSKTVVTINYYMWDEENSVIQNYGQTAGAGFGTMLVFVTDPSTADMAGGYKKEVYLFNTAASTIFIKGTYIDTGTGYVWSWTTSSITSVAFRHMICAPDGKGLVLIPGGAISYVYYFISGQMSNQTPSNMKAITVSRVYDITNRQNPDEAVDGVAPGGAYLLVDSSGSVVSTWLGMIEWIENTGMPSVLFFDTLQQNNKRNLYTLPSFTRQGVVHNCFALGSSKLNAGIANKPFTIIARRGGRIPSMAELSAANNFTIFRAFGSASTNSSDKADLPVAAKPYCEPEIIPHKPNAVRFRTRICNVVNTGPNDDYQNCSYLGSEYDENGNATPIYGPPHFKNYTAGFTLPFAERGVAMNDAEIVEVGNWSNFNNDSVINVSNSSAGWTGFAIKLAESWEVVPSNREIAPGTSIKGGPLGTLWGWYGGETTDVNFSTIMGAQLRRVTIEAEISASNIGRVNGQNSNIFRATPFNSAARWPQASYGFSSYRPIIKKGKVLFQSWARTANLAARSFNEGVVALEIKKLFPMAVFTTADYAIATDRGSFELRNSSLTVLTPRFQMFENQLLPGIYRRRNNQLLNALGTDDQPYFEFTDKRMGQVFGYKLNESSPWWQNGAGGTPEEEVTPTFKDDMRILPLRSSRNGIKEDWYTAFEKFDSTTGNVDLMHFYTDDDGVSTFRRIVIPHGFEYVKRITYSNGFMELYGTANHWKVNVANLEVTKTDDSPDPNAVTEFDMGTDVYFFSEEDDKSLIKYSPNQLVMEYQGEEYFTVPLKDLVIKGNNTIEDLTVTNNIKAHTIEAASISIPSRFASVVIP